MKRVEIDGVLYVPVIEVPGIKSIAKAILRATCFGVSVDESGFDCTDHLGMKVDVDDDVGNEHAATLGEVLAEIASQRGGEALLSFVPIVAVDPMKIEKAALAIHNVMYSDPVNSFDEIGQVFRSELVKIHLPTRNCNFHFLGIGLLMMTRRVRAV